MQRSLVGSEMCIRDSHYELAAKYYGKPQDKILLVAKWDNPYPILDRFLSVERLEKIEVKTGKGRVRTLHVFKLAKYLPG